MRDKQASQKGSILVTLLFMTSILALLVAAVATDSFQSMKTVGQSSRDTQAKYAAYAGLEMVLNELRKNEHYYGEEELSTRHGRLKDNMEGIERLTYEVLIWNNILERNESGEIEGESQEMEGPEGITVSPDTVYIVSSGSDTVKGEEVLLTSMAGTARRIRPVFEDAAFARTKLMFSGADSLVDAWDSQGFDPYVAGDFPGEVGGGGGGGGGGPSPSPNVADYEATLGTDSGAGRTLRLLDGAKLNGHYRVGPAGSGASGSGTAEGEIYGDDSGSSSGGGPFGGSETTRYAVTTSESEDQIAGTEPDTGEGLSEEKAVQDSKATEVPRFQSPVADDDVADPVLLQNQETVEKWPDGSVKKDWKGNPIVHPPAPVALTPGGYESVTVPNNQTLALSSGVYYFRDDFIVNGGKVTTSGSGPVIIFCGKKATFTDATVNEGGRTSAMQLCFTDDLEDEAALDALVASLEDVLSSSTPIEGETMDEYIKNMISPLQADDEGGTGTATAPKRQGFSHLKISGSTQYFGSISGANLVAEMEGGEIFGSIMGNVITGNNAKLHQDLALKGSNLMAAGGWQLESVHQVR